MYITFNITLKQKDTEYLMDNFNIRILDKCTTKYMHYFNKITFKRTDCKNTSNSNTNICSTNFTNIFNLCNRINDAGSKDSKYHNKNSTSSPALWLNELYQTISMMPLIFLNIYYYLKQYLIEFLIILKILIIILCILDSKN